MNQSILIGNIYYFSFEQALKKYHSAITVPYWDSTLDQGLPDPNHSQIWTDSLFGSRDGIVTEGPYANWYIIEECHVMGEYLTRNLTIDLDMAQDFLLSDEDIGYAMSHRDFADLTTPIDNTFEDDHNAMHLFVGGHMQHPECSPADPLFFMHHSFIDLIWERFRRERQTTNLEESYPSIDYNETSEEHGAYEYMLPFKPLLNIHGLRTHYTRYYYRYAKRPHDCTTKYDCRSPLLWCDRYVKRCRAKIKVGGTCHNLPDNSCYDGAECYRGKCTFRTNYDYY